MKPEQERVKNLLTDTVTLLCKNGLNFNKELKVQGLLGITLDDSDVFIVHIDEKCGGEVISVRTDCDSDLLALSLSTSNRRLSPESSETKVASKKSIQSSKPQDSDSSVGGKNHSPKESTHMRKGQEEPAEGGIQPVMIKAEPVDMPIIDSCQKQDELNSRLVPNYEAGNNHSGSNFAVGHSLVHKREGDVYTMRPDCSYGGNSHDDTGPPTAKRKLLSTTSAAVGGPISDHSSMPPFITGILRPSHIDQTGSASNAGSTDLGALTQDCQAILEGAPSWDASSESQGSQGLVQTVDSTAQDTLPANTNTYASLTNLDYSVMWKEDLDDDIQHQVAQQQQQQQQQQQPLQHQHEHQNQDHLQDPGCTQLHQADPETITVLDIHGVAGSGNEAGFFRVPDELSRSSVGSSGGGGDRGHASSVSGSGGDGVWTNKRSPRSKDKPYVCGYPACSKSYFFMQDLRRHEKLKHGGKRYQQDEAAADTGGGSDNNLEADKDTQQQLSL